MQKQKRHVKTSGRRSSRRVPWMAMGYAATPSCRSADGRLPQPAAAMGRSLIGRQAIRKGAVTL